MFQHPARIPVVRALAVWAVNHNAATPEAWAELDAWVAEQGVDRVVDDVVAILRANASLSPEQEERERMWWRAELEGHTN